MGWIRCVGCEKLQCDFVAWNFALIAPVQYVLQQVSCSYETMPNAPKYYEMNRNICIGSNGVDWVRSLQKIQTWHRCIKPRCDFVSRTFVLTAPVRYVWHHVSCSYEMIPNAPKYYETDRNISLESNRVDWVCLLRKIPTWHHGTNFYINCTSSPRIVPSFMQLRNDPKWTQTLWNAPKHEFRVQWGGSGAFVAKNCNVTSWDELLY